MVTKESKNGREIFVAVDANSIIHRAFHSYPPTLETSGGLQVNAVFGFTAMFLKVLKMFKPKYIVCAFDTPKPTFRHTQYADYKATRKPIDQSLLGQFPLVEDIVRSFNVPILKKEGYEADDVLGTLAEFAQNGKWKSSNVQLCIVSGDTDMLQLLDERVSVILPKGSFRNLKDYSREDVFEKLGVYPEQVVDYKAVVGDPSDNVPGIKGIGAKTAAELLQKHGNLEGIYANLESLKPRARTLFERGAEQAGMSRELVQICKDVDLSINLEACLEMDFDLSEVEEKFVELEFKTLMGQIPRSIVRRTHGADLKTEQFDLFEEMAVQKKHEPSTFDSEALRESLRDAKEVTGMFVPANEIVTGEKWILCEIVDKKGEVSSFSFPSSQAAGPVSQELLGETPRETIFCGWEDFVAEFSPLPTVEGVFDIKLLAHLDNSSLRDYSFKSLCFTYLSKNIPDKLDPEEGSSYLDFVKEIFTKIKLELEERKLEEGFFDSHLDFLSFSAEKESSLAIALAHMEKRGVLIEKKLLEKLYSYLEKEIQDVVEKIYYDVGHEFNINSSKQLSDVLFGELGLPPISKTKTLISTKEEVLKKLEDTHPIVSKVLKYRHLTKVMSNYVSVYKEQLDEKEKNKEELSINTDFKQTGTTSGRLSSVNPNMQNLPIGDELGDRLREIFIPRKGFSFVSADYSQIDLRIMAHLSNDKKLIDDFEKGKDIHLTTASRILDKGEAEISSSERRIGKTINFGIIYGLTSYGLSQSLKIPVSDADTYIKEYFENYSGVAKYINEMTKKVQNTRYVETLLGRRRYVMGVTSRNLRIQRAAIREAINMPVQGGSADVMKLAMVEVLNLISEKYKGKVFIILQIHDEVIFEVKEGLEGEFKDDLKKLMEGVINLKVPLNVNINVGKNMAELK